MTPNRYWTPGNIVEVTLTGAWAYGHVIAFPLVGFYSARPKKVAEVVALDNESFAFRIWVMKYAVGKKGWPVIGSRPLSPEKAVEPWFLKRDSLSRRLTKYRDSDQQEVDATPEEGANLECAAVWDPAHVESRLLDALMGRPNKWLDSLKVG